MKQIALKIFYLTIISVSIYACSGSNEDDDIIDDINNSTNSYLSLEKKYNNNITQPKVTLVGEIANDFEVIDAGYWESGNSFKFVNGVISLRYLKNNPVSPTVVVARLKDSGGNTMALKSPDVNSLSETSYILSGGSTFLRNLSPLTFEYIETVDLGGGASVTSTITAENNTNYAQGITGRDVVQLVQILKGDNLSNPDFIGAFSDFAEVELAYFTQTDNINNNRAYVNQLYLTNTSGIKPTTGNFTITANPTYNSTTESWSFSIANATSLTDRKLGYHFVLQDNQGTGVAFEIETNITFLANEAKSFTINKSDLHSDLSFLTASQIQNLSAKLLLEW